MKKSVFLQLKDSVDNPNLLQIGEIRFTHNNKNTTTEGTNGVRLSFNRDVTLTLDSGVFGNNNETEIVVPANTPTTLTFPVNSIMSCVDGDAITLVDWGCGYGLIDALDLDCFNESPVVTYNLRDDAREYSLDGVEDSIYKSMLTSITFISAKIAGNINAFIGAVNVTTVRIENMLYCHFRMEDFSVFTNIRTLRIISSGVTGNISGVLNLVHLTTMYIKDNIGGDIISLRRLSSLSSLTMTGVSMDGDVSVFNNCPSLKTLYIEGLGVMRGDLASLLYIESGVFRTPRQFTWGTRNTSLKIIAGEFGTLSNNAEMITNQASCQTPSVNNPKIYINGTLNVGDVSSALSTLRTKGVAVYLNDVLIN